MAKRHHRRGGRTTPKGTRPAGRHAASGEPPFVVEAEARLGEASPLGLMAMASGIVEVTTPRPLDGWAGRRLDRVDGPSLFASFADSGWPAMGALALAVAALHPDARLAGRIRAAVDPSVLRSGPRWLGSVGEIEITGTWVQTDVLGDGENVVVSWRWRHGSAATAFVYVDHNMGTLVKDAFVVPEAGERLMARYSMMQEEYTTTVPLDPRSARARIVEAIGSGERSVPPFETESWPACRPLVEWAVRHLPEGGTGYERPQWPVIERERLLDEFVASPDGAVADLDGALVRELADPLVWFACDYGPGDPLRWSPVSVEIVLTDWYPRKVLGLPDDQLVRLPDVLAGFIRFAHAATSIPRPLTDETLDAVDRWRPAFLEAIEQPGRTPAANALRLARIAAGLDPDDSDDDPEPGDDGVPDELLMAGMVDDLEAVVIELAGGRDAYDAITDDPLGDMPFDWSAVPPAMRADATVALAHLDRWSEELFDTEVRTIARAVLAGVLAADGAVFKRSARADALAAGILGYLLARLTGRLSPAERRALPWKVFTQKDLADATGVSASSINGRVRTIANVVERAPIDWPKILHSTQRLEIVRTKQHVAWWRSREA